MGGMDGERDKYKQPKEEGEGYLYPLPQSNHCSSAGGGGGINRP
jgi:hypothetical protein